MRIPAVFFAAALLAFTPGCASIVHGTEQDVTVECDSPRALLRADGVFVARGLVTLDRGENHWVSAEEPGKVPVTTRVRRHLSWGYVVLDSVITVFTFPIGLVAPIVDLADGAMWHLDPEHVRLPAPVEPSAPPPREVPY